MRPTSQKTKPNIALQVAIVESRKKSYVIARKARLTPDRLSKIKNGRVSPSDDEQAALVKVLGRSRAELFPVQDGSSPAEAR